MDFYKIPLGFGMALSANFQAMNAWTALPEGEKQALLSKAHQAQSEQEMHDLVNGLMH